MLKLIAALFLIAAAPPEDAVRREQSKLDGYWRMVSVEVDGAKMPAQQVNDFSLKFKGDKFTSFRAGEKKTGTFTIDPTKKPKTLDIVLDDGPDKGKTWSLIYTLEGDRLQICGREAGKDRPTSFDTKDQKDVILMIFRRE